MRKSHCSGYLRQGRRIGLEMSHGEFKRSKRLYTCSQFPLSLVSSQGKSLHPEKGDPLARSQPSVCSPEPDPLPRPRRHGRAASRQVWKGPGAHPGPSALGPGGSRLPARHSGASGKRLGAAPSVLGRGPTRVQESPLGHF